MVRPIPLLKYAPGIVIYYKKNLIEIGDPHFVYFPCKSLIINDTVIRIKMILVAYLPQIDRSHDYNVKLLGYKLQHAH